MIRPGHGGPTARRGSLFSPNGTSLTCSATSRPPPRAGRSTASCPSMACTRMAARATRSLTTVSPQSASWCPVAWTTWSGTSRSTAMPPSAVAIGRRRRRWPPAASRRAASGPGRRGRPRTAARRAARACGSPARRRRRPGPGPGRRSVRGPRGPRASARRAPWPRIPPARPAVPAGRTPGSRTGPRRAGAPPAAGNPGRAPAGARSPPRHRTCWPRRRPAARPDPPACAGRAGSAVRRDPGRPDPRPRPGLSASGPARTLTGCRARNSGVRPGGMTRTGQAAPPHAARAARYAANSPSATPAPDSTPRSAIAAMIRPASAVSPPK